MTDISFFESLNNRFDNGGANATHLLGGSSISLFNDVQQPPRRGGNVDWSNVSLAQVVRWYSNRTKPNPQPETKPETKREKKRGGLFWPGLVSGIGIGLSARPVVSKIKKTFTKKQDERESNNESVLFPGLDENGITLRG